MDSHTTTTTAPASKPSPTPLFQHRHRLEICAAFIALLLAPFLATHLPLSISFLAGVVTRPLFVFSLGNAIIVSLIAKSGKFTINHCNAGDEIGSAIFESLGSEPESDPVVFEDKEMICQKPDSDSLALTVIAEAEKEKNDIKVAEMAAVAEVVEDTVRQLEFDVAAAEENGMSDEEFQRAIEDFIAKQMRFLREESKTVVVFSGHR
ncbi:hypothetical protein Drorol1_Dr00010873 [Drosera rotundifolia]